MARLRFVVLLFCSCLVSALHASDPCYDHQSATYRAKFKPTSCDADCTVTPFFSPDHSVDTYVSLIDSATESVDIYTPDFESWSGCTSHKGDCGGQCIGCTLEAQRNEEFPVFAAALNAKVQRNVKVRVLLNDFYVPTCEGKITPLDWFTLNGIEVRLYTTTTFMHAKVVVVDQGKKTSISSINFSRTSFTRNREAGVVVEDCSCAAIDLVQDVFEADWNQAAQYTVNNTYTKSEMAYITNNSFIPYRVLTPPVVKGAFVTSLKSYRGVRVKDIYTAPDYARETFLSKLKSVQSSMQVMIYQITDQVICNETLKLWKKGVNITLLVAGYLVSYSDYELAKECYNKLYDGGMNGRIRKEYSKFEFAHEKVWIVDDTTVNLSTGNWSPSDFPVGTTEFKPYKTSHASSFRDFIISMEGPEIVKAFKTVFDGDWKMGTEWTN